MDKKPVIILGAGSIGKVAQEIFNSHNVVVYCFLDDKEALHGTEIDEVSVLGKTDDQAFLKYIGQKCDAFVATDDNKERKSQTKMLKELRKVMPMNAVHEGAYVAKSAELGYGNLINNGAQVGALAKVSNHTLIHSNAVVDIEAEIGDYVQIGPGAIVGAKVVVEEGAYIGAGSIIVTGVKIGKNARVGAGSVVISEVAKGETVFGNPAQKIEN